MNHSQKWLSLTLLVLGIFLGISTSASAELIIDEGALEMNSGSMYSIQDDDCIYSTQAFDQETWTYSNICIQKGQIGNILDETDLLVRPYNMADDLYRPFGLTNTLDSDQNPDNPNSFNYFH